MLLNMAKEYHLGHVEPSRLSYVLGAWLLALPAAIWLYHLSGESVAAVGVVYLLWLPCCIWGVNWLDCRNAHHMSGRDTAIYVALLVLPYIGVWQYSEAIYRLL